mmetsp:Transcript_23928/g.65198  ORF Transcript_23928/g.65198 Transcript_23928/m.65198 type:complete len:187 (-) Transcript_23928:374-934(-)
MGIPFGKVWQRLLGNQDKRILMLGLDAAGKTTVLYRLKVGKVLTTVPTVGFNVETVEYRNIHFNVWDVGGQDKIRKLWRHYFGDTDGLIFVVDSSDCDRLEDAREELQKLLAAEELREAVLLVLANKQDLPGAASADEIAGKLGLHAGALAAPQPQWHVQAAVATTGDGLFEGLDWLSRAMAQQWR